MESCKMRDFLAGCNGLSRGFTVNQTADAVTGYDGFMQLPTGDGQPLENGSPFPVCQGKDIDYDFVNKMVNGKPVQQFEALLVGDFCRINARGILFVLFTNQVQHWITCRQNKSTPFEPERKTLSVRLYPFEQLLVLTGKKAVQCHCRYDLYFCHTSSCYKEKRETHAVSDGGSDKAQYRNLHELTP